MVGGPRRLKRLNLGIQTVGHLEVDEETLQYNSENRDEEDDPDDGDARTEECNQEDHDNDNIIVESKRPINIILPDGEVRHVLGDFKVKNLEQLKEGKVFVETDKNGIPNDRSGSVLGSYIGQLAHNSTFAPLHIPKWSDKLFLERHKSIITDVEMKFMYPSETMNLTRNWILKKASKGWRAYKSRLKKKYFNPDERSLNDILKDVPEGVNEFQWGSLLSIWSKEQHKKLCEKNSVAAKQKKNPHTTGRKSHARLCKEMMEARKDGKVHDIEVWDESHKKKDPLMKATVETAYNELAKRKADNFGSLSCKDYDEIFRSTVGKKTKLQGYYDHGNWSRFNILQGPDVIGESEQEKMLKLEVKEQGNKIKDLTADMSLMRAFIEQKFPGVDWRNRMVAGVSNEVDNSEPDDDDITNEFDNILGYGNISSEPNDLEMDSYSIGYAKSKGGECDNPYVPLEHTITTQSILESSGNGLKAAGWYVERPMSHGDGGKKQLHTIRSAGAKQSYSSYVIPKEPVHAKQVNTGTSIQMTKSNQSFVEPTLPHDSGIQPLSEGSSIKRSKTSQMYVESMVPREHRTNGGSVFNEADNNTTIQFANNLQDPHAIGSTMPTNMKQIHSVTSSGTKDSCYTEVLPNQYMTGKALQRKRVQADSSSTPDQREVYLFSLNSAYKDKVVAKGNLVTTDRTRVIGGNMLGDEYYGVAIHAVTKFGDERMPRPLENCSSLKDAIGRVIAWPRFYVKKPKSTSR